MSYEADMHRIHLEQEIRRTKEAIDAYRKRKIEELTDTIARCEPDIQARFQLFELIDRTFQE